jgi:hypothetical protein
MNAMLLGLGPLAATVAHDVLRVDGVIVRIVRKIR